MKRILLYVVLFILSGGASFADDQIPLIEPLKVGETFRFQSTAFEQEVTLQLYLPASYSQSDKSYPVLYMFDGDLWFLHGASLAGLLHHYHYVPELIVVGISAPEKRYSLFNQADLVSALLQEEVFKQVEKNWRASSQRVLFGWQFAGAALLDLLAQPTPVASGFISASPFPISTQRLHSLDVSLQKNSESARTLLFTSSFNEVQVTQHTKQLNAMLNAQNDRNLRWQFLTLDAEQSQSAAHRTTPLETVYQGLRFYFSDYAELEFDSAEQFVLSGGIEQVVNYYQARADRYGLSAEVSYEGVFNLLRMALREPHYELFNKLMQHFATDDFINQTNLGWLTQYARFYLENNNPTAASKLYKTMSLRFPNRSGPLMGLGKAAQAMDKNNQAIQFLNAALELSQKHADGNVADIQTALTDLLTIQKEQK